MTTLSIPRASAKDVSIPTPHASPRRLARTTAIFYLLTIVLGIYAQSFVGDRMIVWTDAAATAHNVAGHRDLWWSALAAYLLEMACNVVMTVLFYGLLKPAGPGLSLVALALGLVGCTIKTVARAFFAVPLFLLGRHAYHAFTPEALGELSLVMLTVNDRAAALALVFFGFNTVLLGWLTWKSRFLPRFLGVLGIAGGAGWLAYLWQPLGDRLFPFIALLALLGSVATIFWLWVFGVDETKWRERERSGSR